MIPVRCPICEKTFEIAGFDDLPTFPFCSERCRLIDLGRWLGGDYNLPASDTTPSETEEPEPTTNGKHAE